MPVHRKVDSRGAYYQWGSQTKYYYIMNNVASRNRAKQLATRQGMAIAANR